MSFEIFKGSQKTRINQDLVCSPESCGCATCPVRNFCAGPNPRCDAKKCTRNCGDCRATCNRNPSRTDLVDSLGGVDFSDVQWSPFSPDLPIVIPQIHVPVSGSSFTAVAINVSRLFYTSRSTWSPEKDLRKRFGLPPSCKIVISFFTNDRWMDSFSKDIDSVCEELSEFSFDYVMGMDFSNYDNYPRFDTIINLRRRMLSVAKLQEQGLKVIPTLGWCSDLDFQRMLSWCVDNKVSVLGLNLQTVRTPTNHAGWPSRLKRFQALRDGLPDCHFVFVGASSPARARSLVEHVGGNIHFMDAKSLRAAEYHKDLLGTEHPELPVLDLFQHNVDSLRTAVSSASASSNSVKINARKLVQYKLPL